MATSSSSSGGIGFFGALTLLFIGLKLTDTVDWSWWLVLSPLWLPITLVVMVLITTYFFLTKKK